MIINSSGYIKNNIQNVEAYKFFEKSSKRKSSPISKQSAPNVSKLLQRRLTRSKSFIDVESFRELLDSEYDIFREDFDSSKVEYEPLKKTTRVSNSNKINEILDKIAVPLDNTTECKRKRIKENEKELVDNIIQTVDTSSIVDRRKNGDKTNGSRNSKFSESQSITESYDQPLDSLYKACTAKQTENYDTHITQSNQNLLQVNSCNPKSRNDEENTKSKASSDKILHDNNELSNKVPVQPKKRGRKPKSLNNSMTAISKKNKTSSDKILQDNNELSNKVPVQPKKRGRKPKSLNNSMTAINKKNKTSSDKILQDNNELSNKVPVQAKKRGRPRKSLNNSITAIEKKSKTSDKMLHDNKELSNKAPVQPKKRGRPRKSLNNSMTAIHKKNSILNYITVQGTQLNKDSNLSTSHEETEQVLLNSEVLSYSAANNGNLGESGIPEKSSSILKKRNNQNNMLNSVQQKEVGRQAKKSGIKRKKYTRLSKLTKEQIKKVSSRKIPKDRLIDVLDMIDNEDHPIWENRNTSCNPYIYYYREPINSLVSDQNAKLRYARQFLLRRDWINLSKILCFSYPVAKDYYPLVSKYTALLLAHNDKDQFDKFIEILFGTKDSSSVIKKCTNISKENDGIMIT